MSARRLPLTAVLRVAVARAERHAHTCGRGDTDCGACWTDDDTRMKRRADR